MGEKKKKNEKKKKKKDCGYNEVLENTIWRLLEKSRLKVSGITFFESKGC